MQDISTIFFGASFSRSPFGEGVGGVQREALSGINQWTAPLAPVIGYGVVRMGDQGGGAAHRAAGVKGRAGAAGSRSRRRL